MKSMTGYGRARLSAHGREITAEVRAVNHRYLDCTVKAPRAYGFLEDVLKKRYGKEISALSTGKAVETDAGGAGKHTG